MRQRPINHVNKDKWDKVRVRSKSFKPPENLHARAFLTQFIQSRYKGNISEAARALRLSQPYLSSFLNGRVGAGMKLLRVLSAASKAPIDEIIGVRRSDRVEETYATRFTPRERAAHTLVRYGVPLADVKAATETLLRQLRPGEEPDEQWWTEQLSAEIKRGPFLR